MRQDRTATSASQYKQLSAFTDWTALSGIHVLDPLNGNIYVANPANGLARVTIPHRVRAATSLQSASSKASARDWIFLPDSSWAEAVKSTFRNSAGDNYHLATVTVYRRVPRQRPAYPDD